MFKTLAGGIGQLFDDLKSPIEIPQSSKEYLIKPKIIKASKIEESKIEEEKAILYNFPEKPIEEVLEDIITSSRMLQAVRDNNFRNWQEDYEHDLKIACKLIRDIENDYVRIFNSNVRTNSIFALDSITDMEISGIESRIRSAAEEWEYRLRHYISEMGVPSFRTCCVPEYGEDIVRFTFINRSSYNRSISTTSYEVVYLNPTLKDPDDYPQKIPTHAKRILETLESVNFNYDTKILNGLLVGYKEDTVIEKIQVDPAIQIKVLGKPVIIDFWLNNFQEKEERKMQSRDDSFYQIGPNPTTNVDCHRWGHGLEGVLRWIKKGSSLKQSNTIRF